MFFKDTCESLLFNDCVIAYRAIRVLLVSPLENNIGVNKGIDSMTLLLIHPCPSSPVQFTRVSSRERRRRTKRRRNWSTFFLCLVKLMLIIVIILCSIQNIRTRCEFHPLVCAFVQMYTYNTFHARL